jgi:hypothetical protein
MANDVTINVDLADPLALGRCEIGTLRFAVGGLGYDDEAVVPGDGWAPLTPDQADELRSRPGTATRALVELFTLADVPRHDAEPEEISAYKPHPSMNECMFLAFAESPADQLTTTIDHGTGNRLGVHLDNFDQRPTRTRELSRRRLAVNLGPGHRYLVMATATIQEIAEELDPYPRYPHTDDIRRYLCGGGGLACLRIRLGPGEGYIAPTELIPHDGSTQGATQPSRIAFWLGHWSREAEESCPARPRVSP